MRGPYGEELSQLEQSREPRLVRALEMTAPGTALRQGIDNVVAGRTGALLLLAEEEDISFLFSGGIRLDVDFNPQLLYQLAKMDGAITLSPNADSILWANVQLMPDPTILTSETGTRHRTAERVSKQTREITIAISEGRQIVSLYIDGEKYVLEEIPVLLAKANQALQTLERYRRSFDRDSTRLTALEFELSVTLHDVLTCVQRAEVLTRIASAIERYIVGLGVEGRLIEMQLGEVVSGIAAEKAALVRDYVSEDSDEELSLALDNLAQLPNPDLIDYGRLAAQLGYDRKTNTLDLAVSPRGYRVLGHIPRLPQRVINNIVQEMRGLERILDVDADLESVDGVGEVRAKDVREGLGRLQETNLVDRYLQT